MKTIFDSRNEFFKKPFGAVKVGENVHFKITLPRYLRCSNAYLVIQEDNNKNTCYHSMYWCGMNGDDHENWECDYIPESSGLIWYKFAVNTSEGMKDILCMKNTGCAKFFVGNMWQLTVYEKDFKTPDWLKGGTMYQIFPDRFYHSEKGKLECDKKLVEDRVLRKDWGAEPQWRPDSNGEVKNNDYFGGNLQGVIEKLDYLEELGITCIYLNPIFEAHSNHRYNTADYSKIDPYLGTEKDFKELCKKADEKGIKIILDGVFSHTGSDSIYFNKERRYDSIGAFNSYDSRYKDWYHFINWPNTYHSWWGFDTLPELEKTNVDYNDFINGENGIVRKWIKAGCAGWRLDVADELPDCFIDNLREAVKEEDPDAIVIGEVWEDASNKESYGSRRRYLLGKQLDSVMNYPFRTAILSFVRGECTSTDFCNNILSVVENYPPQVIDVLMNNIGTHDTERALTILAGEQSNGRGKEWQSETKMTPAQKEQGILLMKMAATMQYTLPGVPCLYYADEAGSEGYKDPFSRYCYPWGSENKSLIEWYKQLGKVRKENKEFKKDALLFIDAKDNIISYKRGEDIFCLFNRGYNYEDIALPEDFEKYEIILGIENLQTDDGLRIAPTSCIIARKITESN